MRTTWLLAVSLVASGCMTTAGSGEVKRTSLAFRAAYEPPQTGWKGGHAGY